MFRGLKGKNADALQILHTHSPVRIFHGDARINNLIVSTDSPPRLFWVDVMQVWTQATIQGDISSSITKDVEVLVKSILRCGDRLPDEYTSLIKNYVSDPSSDNMDGIMELVCAVFK
jgi:hypothetical protein